jgi:hypothetical protein
MKVVHDIRFWRIQISYMVLILQRILQRIRLLVSTQEF